MSYKVNDKGKSKCNESIRDVNNFLSNLKAGDPVDFNFATINYHKIIALQKLKAKKEEKLLKAGKPGSSGVAGKNCSRGIRRGDGLYDTFYDVFHQHNDAFHQQNQVRARRHHSSSSSSSNQAVVESEIIRNDPFCNQKKDKGEQTEDDDIEIDEIDNNNKQKEMWISGRVKKNSRTMATSSTTHKKWENGDSVLIIDDVDMVKEMARGHGGWSSSMEKYCGQKGTVQTNALIRDSSISSLRDSVRVTFDDGCSWHFNSDCLIDVREHESISANDKAQSVSLNLTITYTVTPEIAPYLIEFVKDTEVEREKQFPDSSAANGTEVILSENYEDYSDASKGPLKPGEIGFIVSADNRRCQIRAEKSGRTWWYDCRALFVEGSTIDFKNFSQIKEFDITITSLFDKSLAPAGEKKKDWLQTLNIGDSLEVQVLCEMINKTTGKRKTGSVLTNKWSIGTVVERHQLERKEDVILILDVGTALIPDNKASNHDDAWRPIVVDMTQKDNDDTNINCPSISFQEYLGNKEPVLLSKKDNNNKNSTTNNMATLILDASVSPQFLQKQKTEEIVKSNPKFFENQYIFSPEQGWGMVHCYLEHKDKFVVDFNKKDSTGNESCSMISFNKTPFLHFECNYDNQSQNFPIARRKDARIIGTFLKQCLTCCEHLDPKTAFLDYCYGTYKVSGDGVERSHPRHRETICKTCLMGYCSKEIADGKIHVKCPMCPRDLQLRELDDRKLVSTKQYDTLMKRIKEMEETNDPDMSQFYVEGINVLLCPKCVAPIEKNGGCSSIHCWRCGHQFSEETARKVKKRKPSPNELKIDEARNIGLVWKELISTNDHKEKHNFKTAKKARIDKTLTDEQKLLTDKERNTILKNKADENKQADIKVITQVYQVLKPKHEKLKCKSVIDRTFTKNKFDIVGTIFDLTYANKTEIDAEKHLLEISQMLMIQQRDREREQRQRHQREQMIMEVEEYQQTLLRQRSSTSVVAMNPKKKQHRMMMIQQQHQRQQRRQRDQMMIQDREQMMMRQQNQQMLLRQQCEQNQQMLFRQQCQQTGNIEEGTSTSIVEEDTSSSTSVVEERTSTSIVEEDTNNEFKK